MSFNHGLLNPSLNLNLFLNHHKPSFKSAACLIRSLITDNNSHEIIKFKLIILNLFLSKIKLLNLN